MKLYPLLALGAMTVGISAQPFSCFPRMRSTPSIKPFEQRMPDMPPGLVPATDAAPLPRDRQEAARAPNPVARSPQAVNLGRIYYGYYCATCHGAQGKGDGTVGQSYVPQPSDLTAARVRSMPDGELALAMVIGEGHEPVMDSTAPLERRWRIIHYLRTLRSGAGEPARPPSRGR